MPFVDRRVDDDDIVGRFRRVDARLLDGLIGGGDDEIDLRPPHIGAGNRIEILSLRRVERDQPELVGNRWR